MAPNTMSDARDYRKFLNDAGELNVRLLPRETYTALVTQYRQRPEVIQTVFADLYLSWDLTQQLETQADRGAEPDIAAAAQAVLDDLDDDDWWRVTEAFERSMIRAFREHAEEWSELLDPIFDDQEAQGWRNLQS